MRKRLMAFALTAVLITALLTFSALAAQPEPELLYLGGAPSGLYATEDGAFLIADAKSNTVLSLREGVCTTLAGKAGALDINGDPAGGYSDAEAQEALFSSPWGIAPFEDGWAVADRENNVIRYIKDGEVHTLAGSGNAGYTNSRGRGSSFKSPTGLAVDDKGNLFVADTGNGVIRVIDSDGYVSTLVGVHGRFTEPTGLCWHEGVLYVADAGSNCIFKVENGKAAILAGTPKGEDGGYVNGSASRAEFSSPMGVCVGEDGEVYVADTGNSAVRVIANGYVSTLYSVDDSVSGIYPVSPVSVLAYGGRLVISDAFSGAVLSVPLSRETPAYQDVPETAWYAKAAASVSALGLFEGVSATRFDPEGVMSRAMFVTVLARLESAARPNTIITGVSTFSDVAESAYYAQSVSWAADNGIVDGKSPEAFAPNLPVTRQEMAALLYRYASYSGGDVSLGGELTAHDGGEVSDWAVDAVSWAVNYDVMNGGEGGELRPTSSATRAEAAQLLINYMERDG